MTRTRFRLLAVVLLACLGGCIKLDMPLSDPATAEPDKALCGIWQPTKKDPATQLLVFVGQTKETDGVPRGLMRLMLPSLDKTSSEIQPGGPACGFVTRIKDATYFNMITDEAGKDLLVKENYAAWAAQTVRKTSLCKYKVEGDTLTVWTGLGEKSYSEFTTRHGITDSASLAKYLDQSGDAELFPDAAPPVAPGTARVEIGPTDYKLSFTRLK